MHKAQPRVQVYSVKQSELVVFRPGYLICVKPPQLHKHANSLRGIIPLNRARCGLIMERIYISHRDT